MKVFWKVVAICLCILIGLGMYALLRAQEKPATIAISAESQQAIQSLQKDYEVAQARFEAAQTKIELVKAQFMLLRRAIQDAAPAGYMLDEAKMQYVKKEAEKK